MLTKEELKNKTKEEIMDFIRNKLAYNDIVEHLKYVDRDEFKKEHEHFDMSGYESKTGECTVSNLAILNKFSYLGLYDYTEYLFLDFYKGHGTLYLKYFGDNINHEFEYGGYGTTEIIYDIFQKTIFSGKTTRRRE